MRLKSWSPSSLRSWPTCSDTAASETPRSAAAALTEPSRTTVANARSWVGVMRDPPRQQGLGSRPRCRRRRERRRSTSTVTRASPAASTSFQTALSPCRVASRSNRPRPSQNGWPSPSSVAADREVRRRAPATGRATVAGETSGWSPSISTTPAASGRTAGSAAAIDDEQPAPKRVLRTTSSPARSTGREHVVGGAADRDDDLVEARTGARRTGSRRAACVTERQQLLRPAEPARSRPPRARGR